MAVGRKESNNLVEKAGKAIVDLALSLSSRHAISNAACSEGMRLRNVTYYNGKLYQLNLDGTRGDEIKMEGTPILDYANPLHTFTANDTYTPTQECYLYGPCVGGIGFAVTVDGKPVNVRSVTGNVTDIHIIPTYVKVGVGQVIGVSGAYSGSTVVHVYKEL